MGTVNEPPLTCWFATRRLGRAELGRVPSSLCTCANAVECERVLSRSRDGVARTKAGETKWEEEMPSLRHTARSLTVSEYGRLIGLLRRFKDVFRCSGNPPSRVSGVQVPIPTQEVRPFSTTSRRRSPVERKVIEQEIAKMREQGIIERSSSP